MIFRYKNIIVFAVGLAISLILFFTGGLSGAVAAIGDLSYVGSLIMGMLYATSLGAGFASVAFVAIGEKFDPLTVAVLGGVGAMIADLAILRFLTSGIMDELKTIFQGRFYFIRSERVKRIFKTRTARFFGPLVGFFIIASPLPDELGVLVLASFGVRMGRTIPLFFILNAVGIYLLAVIGSNISK